MLIPHPSSPCLLWNSPSFLWVQQSTQGFVKGTAGHGERVPPTAMESLMGSTLAAALVGELSYRGRLQPREPEQSALQFPEESCSLYQHEDLPNSHYDVGDHEVKQPPNSQHMHPHGHCSDHRMLHRCLIMGHLPQHSPALSNLGTLVLQGDSHGNQVQYSDSKIAPEASVDVHIISARESSTRSL